MVLYGLVEAERGRGLRRRARAVVPRRRQVVVRYSEEEFEIVAARARLARLAVGAWLGQTALDAAQGDQRGVVGLPDLLRLHADITLVARLLGHGDAQVDDPRDDQRDQQRGDRVGRVAALLERLDVAIDAVVAAAGAAGPAGPKR